MGWGRAVPGSLARVSVWGGMATSHRPEGPGGSQGQKRHRSDALYRHVRSLIPCSLLQDARRPQSLKQGVTPSICSVNICSTVEAPPLKY